VAMLMAELEETEHGDEGRAREWMTRAVHARRDPAWTADGLVSERWMPVSPMTGRLDAFQWKDPLAELGGEAAGNTGRDRVIAPPRPAIAPVESKPLGPPPAELPAARLTRKAPVTVPPAVIPLVHVPDDPGTEPGAHEEPETEPPTDSTDGWNK